MQSYAIRLQLSWKRAMIPPRRYDAHWYNQKFEQRIRPAWHPNFPKPKI